MRSSRTIRFIRESFETAAYAHGHSDRYPPHAGKEVTHDMLTSDIVTAHFLCPRKAFLLLYPNASQSTDTPHAYVTILEERTNVNQARHLADIRQRSGTPCSSDMTLLSKGPDFIVNVKLRSRDLEARCDVLTKVRTSSGLGRHSYEPSLVVGTHSSPVSRRSILHLLDMYWGSSKNASLWRGLS